MSNFVLVVDEVSIEEFEKITKIQTDSNGKVRWIPQQANGFNVGTQAIVAVDIPKKGAHPSPPQPGRPAGPVSTERGYRNLRLEFSDEGIRHIEEILTVFRKEDRGEKEQQAV